MLFLSAARLLQNNTLRKMRSKTLHPTTRGWWKVKNVFHIKSFLSWFYSFLLLCRVTILSSLLQLKSTRKKNNNNRWPLTPNPLHAPRPAWQQRSRRKSKRRSETQTLNTHLIIYWLIYLSLCNEQIFSSCWEVISRGVFWALPERLCPLGSSPGNYAPSRAFFCLHSLCQ